MTPSSGFYGQQPAAPAGPPAAQKPAAAPGFYGGGLPAPGNPSSGNRYHVTPGKPYADPARSIWVGHLEPAPTLTAAPWSAARNPVYR